MAECTTFYLVVCITLTVQLTDAGGSPGHPLATAVIQPAWLPVDAVAESFITGGGNLHKTGSHGYTISLQATTDGAAWYHVCGGALIATDKVLTAAHCVVDTGTYRVGVGWDRPENKQTIEVVHVAKHPDYNASNPDATNQKSDLAVLTLDRHVNLTSGVTILTPTDSWMQTFTWWRCDVTGWGRPEVGMPTYRPMLKHGTVRVMSNRDCQRYFDLFQDKIYRSNLCTLNYPNMVSGCEGDGGAPLVCDGELAGILSWGLVQCNGCTPDVFTRVSAHFDWIVEQIGQQDAA